MNRTRRRRRWFIATAALILAYSVAGFLVLPGVIRSQGEKRLSSELGRAVSIGKVRINPFALSVAVEGFDIREKSGSGSFLGWDRLYVRFDAIRSLGGAWVLGDVELVGFHAAVAVNPDGSYNFSDLLAKLAGPAAPGSPQARPHRPLRVASMTVEGARVDFSDHSLVHPFATRVGPLTFSLANFQTAGDRGAPYSFEARTEAGERFAMSGTLSADPIGSRGDFEADDLVIKKYMPYIEGRTRAAIVDGKLSARGRYEIGFGPGLRALGVDKGEVHVRGLRVVEQPSGLGVVELGSLDVSGASADAVAMAAKVGSVTLSDGHVHARRDRSGQLNLLSLAQPAAGSPARAASAQAPRILVSEVSLGGFAVDFADEAVPRGARLSLGNVRLSLGNATLDDGAVMPLHLSFDWAPKGEVQVDGTATLRPEPSVDLKTSVASLELLPLSPYIEQFINARLTQGAVSETGTLKAALPGGQPAIAFNGELSVQKFGIVDSARDRELLGFSRLSVTELSAATNPGFSASIGQVELSKPYARVVVSPDGKVNLASLTPSAGAPAGVPGVSGPPTRALPRIAIGRVTIDGGDFSFADQSVEPNVHVALNAFSGTISGLSSENAARADVNLYGMVGGVGPLDITGKLDPLGQRRLVDLKVDVKSMDLVPLSPYSGKFAGFELARGQLVVDSRVVVDGPKVDATNRVTVNQFTFGRATASKVATGLPVRLGVALLKDANGQIFIDLPVQGSMDDPEFRVGKVVLRVIVNLLTKAAVSPFSLVGSMFGGGGEELAYQEFAPGSSELLTDQLPKLDTLAKALANRPALTLGIEGGADPAADAYALRRTKLERMVRRRVWEARRAENRNLPPPDQLVLAPEERAAMVKNLFDAKFPPGTTFGTPLPPPPAVAAPQPAPPPGLIQRIVYVVTFQKERDESAARKEAERLVAEHDRSVAAAVASGLPEDQMEGRLAEAIEVSADDLAALASARAQRVRDRLSGEGHIGADRLFLVRAQDPAAANPGPRVRLSFQ